MTEPAEDQSVPGDPLASDSRIVVGVDGSAHASVALRWALREARLRNARLEVVLAWQPPMAALPFGATLSLSTDEAGLDAAARHNLDQAVDEAVGAMDADAPEIVRTVVPGAAAMTLIDIASDADLLVVGSHGRTGLRGLVLGSVAHACVQHAACPVVVVRLPEA